MTTPVPKFNAKTPFSENVAGHFAGGEGRADSAHNHILSVTNSGQKPAETLLSLHYANGAKTYEMQQTIQPGDQMWINLASLIRDRVPDRKGNLLPADLVSGTYDVQQIDNAPASLALGSQAVDQTWGYQIAPPIPACCFDSNPAWDPSSFDLVLDGTDFGSIYATDSCNGQVINISGLFNGWGSNNPSVALVTTQKVQAVGVGATTATANGDIVVGGGQYCNNDNVQETAPITVQVPTTLSVLNVTVLPNGQGLNFGCSGLHNYGIMVNIKYQVLDQNGSAILSANMIPHEHGTHFDGSGYDNNIGPTGFTNSTATTAADGTFHDVPLGVCANGAFSSVTDTQFITIIMPDGSAPSVRGQTFTATGQSAGHGTLQNSVGDISATR